MSANTTCFVPDFMKEGATARYWDGIRLKRKGINEARWPDTTYQITHDPKRVNLLVESSRAAKAKAEELCRVLGIAPVRPVRALIAADDIEWTLDSGSGRPLLSAKDARDQGASVHAPTERLVLSTVTGTVPVKHAATVQVTPLASSTQALILKDTPAVLSLGMLIEQDDYSIIWTKKDGCIFYDPDSKLVPTKVVNYVPQLISKRELDQATLISSANIVSATPAIEQAEAPALVPFEAQPMDPAELEALVSERHYLTHLPMHPKCEVCQAAKLKRKQARRQVPGERGVDKATVFGDIVHCDHLVSLACPGTSGANHCLLVKDQATKVAGSFPVKSKGHQAAEAALLSFVDDCPHITLRTDNSKELVAAGLGLRQFLTVTFKHSVPYRPQSNSIIERWGQEAISAARCLLKQSGLPEQFWDLAIMYWTLCYNVTPQADLAGKCPLAARFPGFVLNFSLIPFGQFVIFREPIARMDEMSKIKWHGRGTDGICLGAHIHSDGQPDGSFFVASLQQVISFLCGKVTTLNVIRTVDVRKQGRLQFPIAILRTQAQALKLVSIPEMPPFLLEFARLDSEPELESEAVDRLIRADNPPDAFSPAAAADAAPHEAMGSLVAAKPPDDDEVASIVPSPPLLRHQAGTTKPDYITSEEWRGIGPKTRTKVLSWLQSNPEQVTRIRKSAISFKQMLELVKEASRTKPALANPDTSSSTGSVVSAAAVLSVRSDQINQVVVEFACSEDSQLCSNAAAFGFSYVRLSRSFCDLSTKEGLNKVLRLLEGYAPTTVFHLFGSCPCTSWCTWQFINAKKSVKFAQSLHASRRISLRMVANFCELAQFVLHSFPGSSASCPDLPSESSASFEWPRSSVGWKQPKVAAGLEEAGIVFEALPDGCQLGVVSKKDGVPIKKPWRIMSSSQAIAAHLNQFKCPGVYPEATKFRAAHTHAACQGQDTVATGFYTPFMAQQILTGFQIHNKQRLSCNLPVHETVQAMFATSKLNVQSGVETNLTFGTPTTQPFQHREKHNSKPQPLQLRALISALVVRVILPRSPEFNSLPAKAAVQKELSRLNDGRVWLLETVREWAAVIKNGQPAMVTRVHTILGQKNSEMGVPGEYKARIVIGGNNIDTSTGQPAHELFQEVSGPPSAMTSTRGVLAFAAMSGADVTVRDAESAYIQASINTPDRPQTWIRLPRNLQPAEWYVNGVCRYNDPVVLLDKALYGHPESGALWDAHLNAKLKKEQWAKVEGQPGLYVQSHTGSVLVVYVDDLLLVSPKQHTNKIWRSIEADIKFKDPESSLDRYLGIQHSVVRQGSETTMVVQMQSFLQSAVQRYKDEIGVKRLPAVLTPSLDQDTPMTQEEAAPGNQALSCASHLMKLLFAARMACPWLITQINRLAKHVTKWSLYHDKALKRLMSYIEHNTHLKLVSRISTEDLKTAELHFWPDADHAGDHSTSKSTSGLWLALMSADGKRQWPLAWSSKKQESTSSSTCEAEMISMASGLKKEVIPMWLLLEKLLVRDVKLVCHEDNAAAIIAVQKGYSPALRHLPRTQRIAVGFVNEFFFGDEEDLSDCDGFTVRKNHPPNKPIIKHCETLLMRADIFTKTLDNAKFVAALTLLGVDSSAPT